jgi:hypothetical protein
VATTGLRLNALVEVKSGKLPRAGFFLKTWNIRLYFRGVYFAARLHKNIKSRSSGEVCSVVLDVMDESYRSSGWRKGANFEIRDERDSTVATGTIIRYSEI